MNSWMMSAGALAVVSGMCLGAGHERLADAHRSPMSNQIPFETLKARVGTPDGIRNGVIRVELDNGRSVGLEPSRIVADEVLGVETLTGSLDDGGWFVLSAGDDGSHGVLWTTEGTWTLTGFQGVDRLGMLGVQARAMTDHGDGCDGGLVPAQNAEDLTEFNKAIGFHAVSLHGGAADPEDTVRVLVVYDPVAAGATGSISTYISAMIESANQSYINSGIAPVQLELVAAIQTSPPPIADSGLILRQVTDRFDGVDDHIHTIRDAYDADLVARLVDIPSFCGVGWLAPDSPRYGFTVSDMGCALSNLTFAHEVGHNFGCAHDPDNSSSSYTSFGYGHRWNNNQWRSVMAYSPGSRVPQFSNPSISFDGGVTGIEGDRDNARAMNITDALIANMRTGDGSGIDCNANTLPDRLEIALVPSRDLDRDGQLDSCQITSDPSIDCNDDGIIDDEQVFPRITHRLGPAVPFGDGVPVFLGSGPMEEPGSAVTIRVGATGDLSSSGEFITLNFNNGEIVFDAFVNSGIDCYAPGLQESYVFSAQEFEHIADEGVDLVITSSSSVGSKVCQNTTVSVWIEYRSQNTSVDADGDGVLDSCSGAGCPADLNDDGRTDFVDIAAFVSAYTGMGSLADLNADGAVDFIDVSLFLASYSAGCP